MPRQPVVFVGHGSPMNAITSNEFTAELTRLGVDLMRTPPRAVLVVSAHWQTRGTRVTPNEWPRTIHDFGGFPRELFDVRYPAPGAPSIAADLVHAHAEIEGDEAWGLDHGAWSVLKHLFPNADVPVMQLSLNLNYTLPQHLELGRRLKYLRDEGVLILGSGNVTHNLRRIDRDPDAPAADWTLQFDQLTRDALIERDESQLTARGDPALRSLWTTAHPTIEHYLPLLYTFGASDARDALTFPIDRVQHGTLAMRSFVYRG